MTELLPEEMIIKSILLIRGKKVMLDVDLAEVYGVKTKRLNEQIKRNIDRFPEDFMFQLTQKEKNKVVAFCDHLGKLKYSKVNPFAFTEYGAIMIASVLNSPEAIHTSIHQVVYAILKELMEKKARDNNRKPIGYEIKK